MEKNASISEMANHRVRNGVKLWIQGTSGTYEHCNC